jgi:cation transport ATPase
MKSNADKHGMKSAAKREPHEHHDHHAHMAADFRKRFWISLVLTLPILGLSPVLQKKWWDCARPSALLAISTFCSGFRPSCSSMAAGRFSKGCMESWPRVSP